MLGVRPVRGARSASRHVQAQGAAGLHSVLTSGGVFRVGASGPLSASPWVRNWGAREV